MAPPVFPQDEQISQEVTLALTSTIMETRTTTITQKTLNRFRKRKPNAAKWEIKDINERDQMALKYQKWALETTKSLFRFIGFYKTKEYRFHIPDEEEIRKLSLLLWANLKSQNSIYLNVIPGEAILLWNLSIIRSYVSSVYLEVIRRDYLARRRVCVEFNINLEDWISELHVLAKLALDLLKIYKDKGDALCSEYFEFIADVNADLFGKGFNPSYLEKLSEPKLQELEKVINKAKGFKCTPATVSSELKEELQKCFLLSKEKKSHLKAREIINQTKSKAQNNLSYLSNVDLPNGF